jgi:hypothetical protein
MHSVICVYLHGFLSSENSQKGRWLVQQVQTENREALQTSETRLEPAFKEIITLTYPISTPDESVEKVEALLQTLLTQKIILLSLWGLQWGAITHNF